MLALAAYRASVHEQCGSYLPDSTSPAAEGRFRATLPVRCHVCTARLEAVVAHEKNNPAPHSDALLWPVVPRG